MAVESTVKPNGLKTALDTIIAPKTALENLSVAPTWGWAFLIVVILGMLSLYLMTPANIHATSVFMQSNPNIASLPAQQQQSITAMNLKVVSFVWLFSPIIYLFGALIGAVVLLIFNAIGGGTGTFGKYWAAQWNISMVTALGSLVLAIIVLARGADSFTNPQQVGGALPSLGMLVPESAVKLHAFLSAFTPFSIWAAGLEIAALLIIGKVRTVPAWIGGVLTIVIGAALAAVFAK